jgi:hypothetical protein
MLFSMPVQVVQQSTSSNREEERYEIRHSVDYADSEFLDSGQLSADPIDHTFTSIDVRGSRYTEADGVNDAGAIVGTAYGVLDRLNLPRRTDGIAAPFRSNGEREGHSRGSNYDRFRAHPRSRLCAKFCAFRPSAEEDEFQSVNHGKD